MNDGVVGGGAVAERPATFGPHGVLWGGDSGSGVLTLIFIFLEGLHPFPGAIKSVWTHHEGDPQDELQKVYSEPGKIQQ